MYWVPFVVERLIGEQHQQLLREAAQRRLLRAARTGRRRERGHGWSLAVRALLACVVLAATVPAHPFPAAAAAPVGGPDTAPDAATPAWRAGLLPQPYGPLRSLVAGQRALFFPDSSPDSSPDATPGTPASGASTRASDQPAAAAPPRAFLIFDVARGAWHTAHIPDEIDSLTSLRYPVAGWQPLALGERVLFARVDADAAWLYDPAADRWQRLDPAPRTSDALRRGAVVAAGDAAVFAISGGDVDVYDAARDTLTRARLSPGVTTASPVVVGHEVLFAGGCCFGPDGTGTDAVDVYDASAREWHTARLSQPRAVNVALAVGSRAIFAGGTISTVCSVRCARTHSGAVDVYDAATRDWSVASGMVTSTKAIAVGGKALFYDDTSSVTRSDSVQILDPETDRWRTLSLSRRYAGVGMRVVAAGSAALFLHGSYALDPDEPLTVRSRPTETFDVYDALADTWHSGSLPRPNPGSGWPRRRISVVGRDVLFIWEDGGVDIYDTATHSWRTHHLAEARFWSTIAVVGTTAIFAGGTATAPSATFDVYTSHTR